MKKKLFALLNISTILLSLFLTGCSEKNSKITLNNIMIILFLNLILIKPY